MITGELLTRVPLFAGIPDNERASLAARAADVRVGRDEWVILEGQAPAFFALLEGQLAVFKAVAGHDRQILTYGPGDYFGEVPLLLGSPAIASRDISVSIQPGAIALMRTPEGDTSVARRRTMPIRALLAVP